MYFIYAVLVAFFTTLASVLIYCIYIYGYWKRKEVFTVPPKMLFGNSKELIMQKKCLGKEFKDYYDILKANRKRFGGYYFLIKPILVISDVDLIKKILINDFNCFTDHPMYCNEDSEPLTANLFALKGEKWRRLRTSLNPAFSITKCKMMYNILLSCCKELENKIDATVLNDIYIDILTELSKLNISILSACALGLEEDMRKSLNAKLYYHSDKYTNKPPTWTSVLQLTSFLYPGILKTFNIKLYNKEITIFFRTLVNNVIQYRDNYNIQQKDLMQILLELRNKDKILTNEVEGDQEVLNNEQITAQCLLFLIAGYETSATTGVFLLYELLLNPVLEKKVRDEIKVVLQKFDGQLSYDALAEMKYLDQCISETLRKYPPLPLHSRVCTQEYTIPNSNVTIAKGTAVMIPTYGVHTDPDLFPNPDVFDPDRFLKENQNGRPLCAWIPFGEGPRKCIAYKFGLLQLKVGLVTLLARYKLFLHPSSNGPMEFNSKNILLYSKTPILFRVEKI